MEIPRNRHRGRRAPSESRLTPLPPAPPSPCDDDVDDDDFCDYLDNNHIHHHHHQERILRFLAVRWKVTLPERYLQRYGIEAVNKAARVLSDGEVHNLFGEIRSPGGFAVWIIREVAALEAAQQSTSHSDLLRRFQVVGGGL